MANADPPNDCIFTWKIVNPFLPGRDLEATFYQASPTITQWKLTLRLLDRGHYHWRYLVFLTFDDTHDDRSEVLTERIRLSIELDGTPVFNEEVPNYLFYESNRCKCYFGTLFLTYHRTETHHLKMRVHISLPRSARENVENHLISIDSCLQNLSRDLGYLLSDTGRNMYRNLNLLARNDPEAIQAHSYMLHARWNNFFRVHGLRNTVQTNISKAVLSDILKYMYSGQLGTNWPDWRDHDYISELFHVMHRYGLYHLYKVLVKSDLQQTLETRNPVIRQSHLYSLNFINGRQITDVTHTWRVENNPELTFRFIVRNDNQAGPWFSYTLESTSSAEVHAKVDLAVIKKLDRDDPIEKILPFHEQDYAIKPNETVESKYALFLGCLETFGPSEVSNRTEVTEIKFFIQCYLSVTDGTTINEILNADDPKLQDESVRIGVLSDHMRQLQNGGFGTDMAISGSSRERNPHMYGIHKGIFVSRWRGWFEGLENEIVGIPPEIPENPICILDSDSLRFVLDYIYTGRVFSVETNFIVISTWEIYEFALNTRFYSLASLMRSEEMARYSIELDIPSPDLELIFL